MAVAAAMRRGPWPSARSWDPITDADEDADLAVLGPRS